VKVKVLYDQGSAQIPEDGIIFNPSLYLGVTDGYSGLHTPKVGPRLFNGITGGQLASNAISRVFSAAIDDKEQVENALSKANVIIGQAIEKQGLSIYEPELLPSACFVIARIYEDDIAIVQGGDSLAVWQFKKGAFGGIRNLAYDFERELSHVFRELMKKNKRDRQKVWEKICPLEIEKRRAYINKNGGFAVLNGQSWSQNFWQKVTLKKSEIALLVLFSDGFVPFEWTKNPIAMARKIVYHYKRGGLQAILRVARKKAEKEKSLTPIDFPEATAIAINF
jgi:hypothetical protein